jgi:hypothetical protein
VQQVTASDGSSVTLYLCTTLQLTVEQLVQLYGRRWDVETDPREVWGHGCKFSRRKVAILPHETGIMDPC